MTDFDDGQRPRWLGLSHRHLESCASTNDEAAAWARGQGDERAPNGAVVSAGSQTRGRGRLGRVWESPPAGNLYLSVVLRPRISVADVPAITLAAGIAVAETVNALGAKASLKWPNDVLCQSHRGLAKLAGILTEMSSHGETIDHVVVGIGLNVGSHPMAASMVATSLAETIGANGATPAIEKVMASLLVRLEHWFDRFTNAGLAGIRESYEALLDKRTALSTEVAGRRLVGHPLGITPRGALQLLDEVGVIHEISAGEVSMVESGPR